MQIVLNKLQFYAYHGALAQENVVGAMYEIDLVLHFEDSDVKEALWHDQLTGTVNYAEVYDLVKREMTQPSALLEHVAARIVRTLLRSFRLIRKVQIAVRKCVPPISGFVGTGVEVRYEGERELRIWDFDGTLADTAPSIIATMQAAFKECGLMVPSDEAVRSTIGLPLIESVRQLSQATDEVVQQATDTYRQIFTVSGDKNISLFPGVLDVLQNQHETGYFVGIATSRSHESVVALCRTLGIEAYVDGIVACEDVAHHKPAPDAVWALCRMLNAPVHTAVVYGDTSYDMKMGRNAGVAHCIGVAWGNHDAEKLTAGGAERVVSDVADL